MDPVSIIAAATAAIRAVYSVYTFIDGAVTLDQTTESFLSELNSLENELLSSLASCLQNCKTSMQEFEVVLGKVKRSDKGKNPFAKTIRKIRLDMNASDIVMYRRQVATHTSSIQIILTSMNLHISSQNPRVVYSELEPKINTIIELLSTLDHHGDPSEALANQDSSTLRMAEDASRIIRVARKVISSARSVVDSGSTVREGSVISYQPHFGSDQRVRINRWNMQIVRKPVPSSNIGEDTSTGVDYDSDEGEKLEVFTHMVKQGQDHFRAERYVEAESFFDKARTMVDGSGLDSGSSLLFNDARLKLAQLYTQDHRLDRAKHILNDLLSKSVLDIPEAETEQLVEASYALAVVHLHLKEFDEAERRCKHTMKARRRIMGKESPAYLECVGLLAVIYEAKGDAVLAATYQSMLPKATTQLGIPGTIRDGSSQNSDSGSSRITSKSQGTLTVQHAIFDSSLPKMQSTTYVNTRSQSSTVAQESVPSLSTQRLDYHILADSLGYTLPETVTPHIIEEVYARSIERASTILLEDPGSSYRFSYINRLCNPFVTYPALVRAILDGTVIMVWALLNRPDEIALPGTRPRTGFWSNFEPTYWKYRPEMERLGMDELHAIGSTLISPVVGEIYLECPKSLSESHRLLPLACVKNDWDAARLLLWAGANPDSQFTLRPTPATQDFWRWHNPIREAIYRRYLAIVKLLVEKGAKLRTESPSELDFVLHAACSTYDFRSHKISPNTIWPEADEAACLIIKAWGNGVNSKTSPVIDCDMSYFMGADFYLTQLTLAARLGLLNTVMLLLDKGANIEATVSMPTTKYNKHLVRTPLGEAAKSGHMRVVRVLLERGADVEGPSTDKQPFDLAYKAGHLDIASLLLAHSKKTYLPYDDSMPWFRRNIRSMADVWAQRDALPGLTYDVNVPSFGAKRL